MKRHVCFRGTSSVLALAYLLSILQDPQPGLTAECLQQFPRPAAIWAPDPLNVVLAFPRPITADLAGSLVGRKIAYGGMKVGASPTGSGASVATLTIAGTRLADSGRTLILATDPHPTSARYQLHLGPDPGGTESEYDLSGIEVSWSGGETAGVDDAEPEWKGWWPEIDLDAARWATRGSAPHERGFELLNRPGRLAISAQVLLPPGEVQVRLESNSPISEASLGDEQAAGPVPGERDGEGKTEITVQSRGEPTFLAFILGTGPKPRTSLRAFYRVGREGLFRPLEKDRLFLPWAPLPSSPAADTLKATPADLSGGNPDRGLALFFGDQAKCSQCHTFGGRGGTVGPDLSDIRRKGSESIYQGIAAPSAEIASEYIPFTVATRDGRVLVGLVKADGPDSIRVTDTNARSTILRRDEIDQIRPSATSIMPVGLAAAIGPAGVRDLIAYLMSENPPRQPTAK